MVASSSGVRRAAQLHVRLLMRLDQRELEMMRATYSDMSNEELAYILSTRAESLTDEAKAALAEVVRARGSGVIAKEIEATTEDLRQQTTQANLEIERQQKLQRFSRRLTFGLFGVFLAGGVIVGVSHDVRGYFIAMGAVAFYALYWVRRLLWKLIQEMFRMNYSK